MRRYTGIIWLIYLFSIVILVSCFGTTSATETFSYSVHIETKDTNQDIANAEVTLLVANAAPLKGVTDVSGFVRIQFDISYIDQPATLIIDANGYQRYRQAIDLKKDMLPDFIQLEPLPASDDTLPSPSDEPIEDPVIQPTVELTEELLIKESTSEPTEESVVEPTEVIIIVQADDTGRGVSSAQVTITVTGKVPINATANPNGVVTISIHPDYIGEAGELLVEAPGYQDYKTVVDLVEGAIPNVIELATSIVATLGATSTPTPTLTPTPTPAPVPPGDMVRVPAGNFFMGSLQEHDSANLPGLDRDPQPEGDEFPQRTVFLPEFWIDRTEVTNAKYRECVDAGVCAAQSGGNPDYHVNPAFGNYPAIYVSWDDARSYCEWAGKRLPTEAEWEKAARGTDGRIWPWGNALKPDGPSAPVTRAHVGDGTANDATEVGSYPDGASPYGALDMTGNVWEWVNDWYQFDYYAGRPDPDSSPSGPSEGESNGRKVIRGGSYRTVGVDARTAERNGVSPGPSFDIGFRCAWSP